MDGNTLANKVINNDTAGCDGKSYSNYDNKGVAGKPNKGKQETMITN